MRSIDDALPRVGHDIVADLLIWQYKQGAHMDFGEISRLHTLKQAGVQAAHLLPNVLDAFEAIFFGFKHGPTFLGSCLNEY